MKLLWNKICCIFEKLFLIKMDKTLTDKNIDTNLGKLRGILFKLQLELLSTMI